MSKAPVRARQLPSGGEKLLRAGVNSRLALNTLHHNRADLAAATLEKLFKGRDIVRRRSGEPAGERLKRLLLRRLRRRRERCKRTPVEALLGVTIKRGASDTSRPSCSARFRAKSRASFMAHSLASARRFETASYHGMRSEGSTLSFDGLERMRATSPRFSM